MSNKRKHLARQKFGFFRQNKAIALSSLVVLLLVACDTTQTTTTTPSPEGNTTVETSQANTESTNLEDVAEDTQRLIGQTVTVEGEVEEVVGANAYRMQENELFGGDEVLIVNANPTVPVSDDQNVRVTGEVRQFVVADLERDYNLNWDLEVQRQLEAEYQDKPVIVAESTEVI